MKQRKLNEDIITKVYVVGYVEESIDGMALFNGLDLFSSYENAWDFINTEYTDYPVIDYVNQTMFDYVDGEWEESNDELLDINLDGENCIGYVLINSQDVN